MLGKVTGSYHNTKMKRVLYVVIGIMAMVGTTAQSLESTANGSLDTQASWSALKNLIDINGMGINLLKVDVNKIRACNSQKKLWAPGPGADADGCVATASGVQVTTVNNSAVAWRWPSVTVACPAGTKLVGGGGSCANHASCGDPRMPRSQPNGNGWYVACDTGCNQNMTATAWAMCAQ